MRPINLAKLQREARRLSAEGISDREIVRRTGLTYHHVFSATRPGYAAKKARQMKERRWLAAGLGEPPRRKRRESGGGARWRGRHRIPPHAHPLVRQVIEEINLQRRLMSEVAAEAGVRLGTVSTWRYERLPRLDLLEAVLGVLGLELVILPKRGESQPALHPAAPDIIDAAYHVGDAHRRLRSALYTPAEREARERLDTLLTRLARLTEVADV